MALEARFGECGLKMHPEKTKIAYCGTDKTPDIPDIRSEFTFLGFCFRARGAINKKTMEVFKGFLPAVSNENLKKMRRTIRGWKLGSLTHLTLEALAEQINPVFRGWVQYFGAFYRTSLYPLAYYLNQRLAKWVGNKYKRRRSKARSFDFLGKVCKSNPKLFVHWQLVTVC